MYKLHHHLNLSTLNSDGFVISPSAALRCILRRCGVPLSTPHSSGFARLASGAFYFAMPLKTFYEIIKLCEIAKKISNESGKASCGGGSYGKGVKQRVKGPIHIGVIDGYSGMAAV